MKYTEEAVSLVVEPATAETVIAADVCQGIKGNSEEEKSNKILIGSFISMFYVLCKGKQIMEYTSKVLLCVS